MVIRCRNVGDGKGSAESPQPERRDALEDLIRPPPSDDLLAVLLDGLFLQVDGEEDLGAVE